MKAIFVAALIFAWMPLVLFKPHVGVLLWSWISHMVPHEEAGGFVETFQFLNFVAVLTLAGLFLGKDKKEFVPHPVLVMMLIYLLWVVITTLSAIDPAMAYPKLEKFVKMMLFAVITVIVMQSPNRLRAFVGVMAVSLLYQGFTGGLFTIATGGNARVLGVGGMMADNNQLATAMAMLIPLLFYYIQHPPKPYLRWPAIGSLVLTCFAILGTQSRGGFVAMAAVLFALLMKSRRRFLILALMIPAAFATYEFMPDRWKARMESTSDATDDQSFRGRLVMWRFATNVVDEHPIEGGGFDVFYVPRARELYTPYGERARAVHSNYFEVLGEHGYVGLLLYLTMIFTAWFAGGSNYKRFGARSETRWLGDLSNAMRIGLMGYCVGGLTLNLATFDLAYHFMAVIILCKFVGDRVLADQAETVTEQSVEKDTRAAVAKPHGQAKGQSKGRGHTTDNGKWTPYGRGA